MNKRARWVDIAIDSTGFSLTQASVHYQNRSGIQYKHYVKAFFGADTRTQFDRDLRLEPQTDSQNSKRYAVGWDILTRIDLTNPRQSVKIVYST